MRAPRVIPNPPVGRSGRITNVFRRLYDDGAEYLFVIDFGFGTDAVVLSLEDVAPWQKGMVVVGQEVVYWHGYEDRPSGRHLLTWVEFPSPELEKL